MNNNRFFNNYRGRYSQYWVKRFGLIPELPTHYDNANSIYELLAWLQRGFKQLMDDFANLEMEFSDFQDAIKELLEQLIPELIRNFAHSREFRNLMKEIIKDVMNDPDMKDWFSDYLKDIMKRPEFKEFFKEYFKDLMKDPAMREWFKDYYKDIMKDPDMKQFFKDYLKENLKELINDPEFQKILDELLKNNEYLKGLLKALSDELDALRKLLNNSLEPDLTLISATGEIGRKLEWSDPNSPYKEIGLGIATMIAPEQGKSVKYTWYMPKMGYVKARQNLNRGDELLSIPEQSLLDAGMSRELLNGIYSLNNLFLASLVTSEGKQFTLRVARAKSGDGVGVQVDAPIYPAQYPIPAGSVFSLNIKPSRYKENAE